MRKNPRYDNGRKKFFKKKREEKSSLQWRSTKCYDGGRKKCYDGGKKKKRQPEGRDAKMPKITIEKLKKNYNLRILTK